MPSTAYTTPMPAVKALEAYRCSYCEAAMLKGRTPANEPVFICQNRQCQSTVYAAHQGLLQPLSEDELALLAAIAKEERLRATISAFDPGLILYF